MSKPKFTVEKWLMLAHRFNNLTFTEKIKKIRDNPEYLKLCNDYEWVVRPNVDDDELYELDDAGVLFYIDRDWGNSEFVALVGIIGIEVHDL